MIFKKTIVNACLAIFLLSFSGMVFSETVTENQGNIFLVKDSGEKIQLTASSRDALPVLSPNKQLVAFVRTSKELKPKACINDNKDPFINQLWVYDLKTQQQKLLVSSNIKNCANTDPKAVENNVRDINNLIFSQGSQKIYFSTSAWATSAATHVVNVDGTNEHFFTAGNANFMIPKGQYKNDVLMSQHRYYLDSGSYEWDGLYTPEGKEVGPVSQEWKTNKDILEM